MSKGVILISVDSKYRVYKMNDDYDWCKSNSHHLEAKAFLAWCEAMGALSVAIECKYVKEAHEKLDSLHDEIWGNLFDLRESLDNE